MCGLQEGWIREKEQILSSEDHGKDLTGAVRLLSQHKALEDEMSGRAAHLQQTIKQGEELVANNHFGSDKIKERIQDIQVRHTGESASFTLYKDFIQNLNQLCSIRSILFQFQNDTSDNWTSSS